MPSFAFLLNDQRGDDLVTYPASLHSGNTQQHLTRQQSWQPSATAASLADPSEGQILYEQQCATCHDANGLTRFQYQAQFAQSPANIFTGPFKFFPSSLSIADRTAQLSR